jgi:hypothetical protein
MRSITDNPPGFPTRAGTTLISGRLRKDLAMPEKEDRPREVPAAEEDAKDNIDEQETDEEEDFDDEDYPPPQMPSRLVKRVIGGCILVALVIAAIYVRYVITRPAVDVVGKIIRTTGTVTLLKNQDVERAEVHFSTLLYEAHRIRTATGASAILHVCTDREHTTPVRIHLRENTLVTMMKPPSVEIEQGVLLATVPGDSMGLDLNYSGVMGPGPAKCLVEFGSLLAESTGTSFSVSVYKGKARIISPQGEVHIETGFRSFLDATGAPAEPVPIADTTLPQELR